MGDDATPAVRVTGLDHVVINSGDVERSLAFYLGELGLYSGYDEKALMESVYYGLPMYTFTEPLKTEMPLPEAPDLLVSTTGGITTASLNFSPSYEHQSATDGGEYFTVEGSAVAVPTGASPSSRPHPLQQTASAKFIE